MRPCATEPGRVIVIGYGNPLRGDDGVGLAAIERLESLAPREVELIFTQQLTPELAQSVATASLAICWGVRT